MSTYQGNYRDFLDKESKRLKDNRASSEDRSNDNVRKSELNRLRNLRNKNVSKVGNYITNINIKRKNKIQFNNENHGR